MIAQEGQRHAANRLGALSVLRQDRSQQYLVVHFTASTATDARPWRWVDAHPSSHHTNGGRRPVADGGLRATIGVHGTRSTRSGRVPGRVRGLRGRTRAVARRRACCRSWLRTCPPIADVVGTLAAGGGPLSEPAMLLLHPMTTLTGVSGNGLLQYAFSLLNLVLGVLLIVRRPDELVPRLLALGLLGTAATFNLPSHEAFHILGSPWPIALHPLHLPHRVGRGLPVGGGALPGRSATEPDRGVRSNAVGAAIVVVTARRRAGLLVERFPAAPAVLRDLLRHPDPGGRGRRRRRCGCAIPRQRRRPGEARGC